MSVGTKEVAGLKCRCLIYLVIECLARVTFVPVCHVSNAEEEGEEVEDTNRRIDYRVRSYKERSNSISSSNCSWKSSSISIEINSSINNLSRPRESQFVCQFRLRPSDGSRALSRVSKPLLALSPFCLRPLQLPRTPVHPFSCCYCSNQKFFVSILSGFNYRT